MSDLQPGRFPATRLRRVRRTAALRRLVAETSLSPADLVWPVFVTDGAEPAGPVVSMPGVRRYRPDSLLEALQETVALGIPAIALFPVVASGKRTPDGEEAANPDGLAQETVRAVKREYPQLAVITDVALDPYTSHGQDGIVDESGYVLNDETLAMLVRQAVSQAAAGADIVAPSDMMDGRVGAIRQALEAGGHPNTLILAYAAKYASCFYGPFRDAVGSAATLGSADKRCYQMDPSMSDEALREVGLDVAEGADIVMVKPALAYLDIIRTISDEIDLPLAAYNVSGEYALLKAAAANGWVDYERIMMETLTSIRRAGAQMILTYHALEAARLLR